MVLKFKFLDKLPSIFRNKYFLTILLFAIWIVLLDSNNLVERFREMRELKKLRREQHCLSRKKEGSKNREKQRVIVALTYQHVQNQRNDFQHKLAKHHLDEFDLIVTEKLNPINMM